MIEPQIKTLREDLSSIYKPEIVEAVIANYDVIQVIQRGWDDFIAELILWFGIDDPIGLRSVEEKSMLILKERLGKATNGIILGFDGPGGTGKGTIIDQVSRKVLTSRAINATSRTSRPYEQEGVHYFFKDRDAMLQGIRITDESKQRLASTLDIEQISENTIDNNLADRIEEYCNRNEIMISLELETSQDHDALTLAYKPNRGWYSILRTSVLSSVHNNSIGVVEESGYSWRNLAFSLKNEASAPTLAYVIVLPQAPIAFTLAARAFNRDGTNQTVEQLLSTIGTRHIDQTKILLQAARELDIPLAILINDELKESSGGIETRAGEVLIQTLQNS